MLAYSDRSHRVQQRLEQVTVGALYVYAFCAVVSISAMQAAYIFALLIWMTRVCLQGHNEPLCLPLLLPVGGFFLASVLATITAVAPYRSLVELRNVLEVLLFYLIVNQVTSTERATTLTKVLIAAGTGMALYGLGQSLARGADFRIYGTMSIYITFASLLMLVALMTLAQLLFRTHAWHVLWALPALLIITAALVMTHTRSAWLGFLVGCGVLVGLYNKRVLLALPLCILVVFLLAPQAVKTRALSMLDWRDITVQQRVSMWSSGVHILRDHPWTGVGMGAMAQVYQRYREPDSSIEPTRRLGHLHNNIVQVAVERGLLGLACWLWLWVAYIHQVWLIYRCLGSEPPSKALVGGSLASVVGFHVAGLFDHTFGDSEVITLVYFFMALPFVVQRARLSSHSVSYGVHA